MRKKESEVINEERLDDIFDRLSSLRTDDINKIKVDVQEVVYIGEITVGKDVISFKTIRIKLVALIVILTTLTIYLFKS